MRRNESGDVIVSAMECCELFEESQTEALAPIRECWFCKWSDFRRNTDGLLKESSCHHPKNQIKQENTAGKPNHDGTKGE